MDWPTVTQNLFLNAAPLLPGAAWQRVGLPVSWAILLACAALMLGQTWPARWRVALALAIAALTVIPGPTSPAYWLGLAFQTPSLMSTLICLVWMGRLASLGPAPEPAPTHRPGGWVILAITLGWLLFLDSFAVWPVSLYRWGFGPLAVATVAVLACLPWLTSNTRPVGAGTPGLVLIAVTLFVLTRLPGGNLWDALIDPWLWLALHVAWVNGWLRHWLAKRRASAAIRG